VHDQGIRYTFTDAHHTGGGFANGRYEYAGEPTGIVIEFEDGFKVYDAGDTCAFLDMQLIGRIHKPDVAILPIGGHFTMDHREAAIALELLGVPRAIPCHYATLKTHIGDPHEFAALAPAGTEVTILEPGVTVPLVRA
jgi:L-ascorbate metabolism protein UlaG (beta-lactamase superfamily)